MPPELSQHSWVCSVFHKEVIGWKSLCFPEPILKLNLAIPTVMELTEVLARVVLTGDITKVVWQLHDRLVQKADRV